MKQRVAIARTLAYGPSILLMDEPFGALDAHTRTGMQHELLEIWERDRKTVLFVTHSVEEAVFLSDRVVVLTRSPGRIKQIIDIDLPRPRRRAELLVDRRYQQYVVDIEKLMDNPAEAARDDARASPPSPACRRCSPAAACSPYGKLAVAHLRHHRPAARARGAARIAGILTDKESLLNILDSIRRMAIGFALALAFAVPVGLMMGRSRLVAAFFNPLLMIIYPVPKAALMPIIMLWLGVGDASKTLVIFLGVSLPVIYHSYQGARAVEEKMLWSAAAMGMGRARAALRVVFPAALPEIMVGIRTGLVLALITMVTSEMIARKQGVGDLLFNALAMAQYETVYATIVIIGVLGFIIDVGFERLRAHLVAWAEPAHEIAVGST